MASIVGTGLAVLTVALLGIAILFMNRGNLMLAGLTFLAASLTIYFRETRA